MITRAYHSLKDDPHSPAENRANAIPPADEYQDANFAQVEISLMVGSAAMYLQWRDPIKLITARGASRQLFTLFQSFPVPAFRPKALCPSFDA